MADAVRVEELRVLDGPNLYFPRPAIKLTVAVPGWMRTSDGRVRAVAEALAIRAPPNPGGRGASIAGAS